MNERNKQWLKSYYSKMRDIHKMVYDKYFDTKKFIRITNITPTHENYKQDIKVLLTLKQRMLFGLSSQIYLATTLPLIFVIRRMFPRYGIHSLFLLLPGICLAGTSFYYERVLRKCEQDVRLKNKDALEKYN